MKLPIDLFLQGVDIKKVYYFSSERLNTETPHYFICIAKTPDDILILTCCTSQFEKRKKFIQSRNLPLSTLVWIKPDDKNGLLIDSYVDCNSYFDYTLEHFKTLYKKDRVEFKGEISDNHLEQIIIGIKASPLVEEFIKNLI